MDTVTNPGLPEGTLRVRAIRGIAWNLLATVGNQGSTFATNIVLANFLGGRVFGEYAMVLSTVAVLSVLGQLATGYTATKYIAEFRTRDPDRAGRLFGLLASVSTAAAGMVALGLLLGAPALARDALQEPALTPALRFATPALLFSVANGFLTGALAGLESYGALGRIGAISGACYLLAAILGAIGGGLTGALLGIGTSGLLQCVLLWRAVGAETRRRGITVRVRPRAGDATIMLKFALPAALNGFVSVPAIWFGNAVVVRQPDGFRLLALFAAANSFRVLVLFLPNIVNNVNMALINQQKGVADSRGYRRVFWFNFVAILAIIGSGAAVVSLLGPWLLALFGAEFIDAYPILLLLMIATVAEGASLALLQVIQSQERLWFTFWGVSIPSYVALALLAWRLTPEMGAMGLGWAYLGAALIALLANAAMVWRIGTTLIPKQAESRQSL
jgi:O-antigen/teichoic acid export membrane protein